MCSRAISSSDGFEEGVRVRCSALEFDRQSSEQDDLHCGSTGIPEWSTDSILVGDARGLQYYSSPLDFCRHVTSTKHSRVAAQVQLLTTAEATRPDLTDRPAVLKTSDVCSWLLYRRRTYVVSLTRLGDAMVDFALYEHHPKSVDMSVSGIIRLTVEVHSRKEKTEPQDDSIAGSLAEWC